MFGLGFSEILCIVVIGIIILGPEHMPRVARKIGEWLAKMRSAATSLNDAISRDADLSALRNDVLEVHKTVRDAGKLVDPQKLLLDADNTLNQIAKSTENGASDTRPNETPQDAPAPAETPAADAETGKPLQNLTNSSKENVSGFSPSTALFDRLERFYDQKRGTRAIPLAKAILVPSRIARATSRFSHRLAPPNPATAQTRTIALKLPDPRRAIEVHRYLNPPVTPHAAHCKTVLLKRNAMQP